ncbi:hypothetical protein ACFVSU_10950 [Microbacterium sp. NPDC058062]|uniref:hypothetical protein n=1 Tax=Microbacterium sp. NPDC058062 TaxID=3346320 RepID=UPI0036DF1AB2
MNGPTAPERTGTTAATGVAARLVLAWVDCYTNGVSAETSERRRAEIHSDLWEQQADARASERPPYAVTLSIARRAVLGAPADLLWAQTQRAASRGLPAEQKARSMNTATRLLARWWWVVGAAVLAVLIFAMSLGQLLEPGMPYLEGTIQGFTMSALLAAGVVLRARMPRTAGTLVVAGGSVCTILWWAPLIMVLGIVVVVGAAIEVVRLLAGRDAGLAVLASAGLLAVAATPVGYIGFGFDAGALGWMWFVLGAVGVALLIAVGTSSQRSAARAA